MKSEQQYNKEFVCKTFRSLYLSNWRGKGKTQQEFAEAISEVMGGAKCDNRNVSRWLNGDTEPVMYLPAICTVLNVDQDIFIPKTHNERYQYSSDFAEGLEQKLEQIAEDDFKIDLTFLKGLRNIIPDFDTRFPICTPLVFRDCDSEGQFFKRAVPAAASETAEGKGLLQVTREGIPHFLTIYDLKILMSIQKKVKKYVYAIFDKTEARLRDIEADANTKYIEVNDDIWIHVKLSDEELQKIDPYGFYTEAERKKYHITEDRKIYTEQEDIENADT